MNGGSDNEGQIEVQEPAVAVGSGENFARGEAAADGVDDGDKRNADREDKNNRGAALCDVEDRVHRQRFHARAAVARFSPAIDSVGDSAFGQNSVQLIWLWQE